MNSKLSTAVVFIVFKRPSQTAQVFQAIAEAKPERLYIIADGPRNSEEALLCEQTRQIVEHVHWDCDVRKNYSEVNLGVRKRIISGLDWVFMQEERAIILEDDCLPHPTFFPFCEELLELYHDDTHVMHISGDSFLQEKRSSAASYYFSKYAHVWGWATWRRAWHLFHRWDNDFSSLELDFQIFQLPAEREFWRDLLEQLRSGRMDYTWDYQWGLIGLASNALCVMPKSNLVTNIGFGMDATHTKGKTWLANLRTVPMSFPLIHPLQKRWDLDADRFAAITFFTSTSGSWISLMKSSIWRFITSDKKSKVNHGL